MNHPAGVPETRSGKSVEYVGCKATSALLIKNKQKDQRHLTELDMCDAALPRHPWPSGSRLVLQGICAQSHETDSASPLGLTLCLARSVGRVC